MRCFTVLLAGALLVLAGCGKKADPAPDAGTASIVGETVPADDPEAEKDKAARAEAVDRLKKIGKAAHAFESAFGHLPAGVYAANNTPGLSWRVQLLPYLGEDALYRQFKQTEAWDSPANKLLVEKMPKVFASVGKAAPAGHTFIRSFVGESAIIPTLPAGVGPKAPKGPLFPLGQSGMPVRGSSIVGISDGSSNTLFAAEAAEAVPWTKPDELPFPGFAAPDRLPPAPKLGGTAFPDGFHALMADGAVRFFPATLPDKTISMMITRNGGEVLPPEVSAILFPPKPKGKEPPATVPASLPDAAARRTAVTNLQQLVQVAHAHHDANGYLPAGVIAKGGALGLSWRVQVLPYLGEDALYKQFKLDEPWDSEANKPLLEKMPKVFASPGKAAPAGHTFVRTTQGSQAIVRLPDLPPKAKGPPLGEPGRPLRGLPLAGILDGTANTILFLEAGEAVPWTKPDEVPIPPGNPFVDGKTPPPKPPKVGGAFPDGAHVALADGTVAFLKAGFPERTLWALLTPMGAEVDFLDDQLDHVGYLFRAPARPKQPGPPPKTETKLPGKH